MPATRNSHSYQGSSNREESSFNLERFTTARNDTRRPYPSETDVYRRSSTINPDEGFFDLGLRDFLIANRRVARRSLNRLAITPYQSGLLHRGAQHFMDSREPFNAVLQASLGYTASVGVACFDELASVFEQTEELNARVVMNRDGISEAEQRMRETVAELRGVVEAERRMRREATRDVASLTDLVNGLVQEVGNLRDDLARVRLMRARDTPLGRGEPQPLVPFEGRLVPIMSPAPSVPSSGSSRSQRSSLYSQEGRAVDRAEDQPVGWSEGEEVVDLVGEEEEQAEEDRRNGVESIHAKILRVREDPAPEYLPAYDEVIRGED